MNRIVSIFIPFLAFTAPLWAVTPMEYYHSLVAGGDEAGFRDGSFVTARFHDPSGLAFNRTGTQLYVADPGNHRIRVIDLAHNNAVRTVAGTGSAGTADGLLSTATFDTPTRLASLPGDRLAVFDAGNGSIRLIDLQSRTVSTLVKGLHIWNMLYRPQDECLYFSEPDDKKIQRMDLRSRVISDFLSNNDLLPSPRALCLYQDGLCAADTGLSTIYEIKPDQDPSSVRLSALGKAKEVLALSSSDGHLYALQKDGLLVKVGLPKSSPVHFPTPWGFLFKNQDHGGATALFKTPVDIPVGFLASPDEARKLYISGEHSIVSVKDYDFETEWSAFKDNNDHLTDFDYPAKKPARTFRILTIGTSRNSTAVPLPSDPNGKIDEHIETPRVFTFSKQLELLLNTEASLRNLDIHFEVLNLTHRGDPLSTYAYYEVPDDVKKYDIDLVLGLADQTGYKDYYERPMTAEGVPARSVDYEYLMAPLSQRARSPVALDLLKRCKQLKIPVSEKQDFPGDGYWSLFCDGDAQVQADLREMTGRRLRLLREKLDSMRTSGGNCPQLVLEYVPGGGLPNDCCAPFWRDVCAQYHLKFLDLSEPFNALKNGYAPVYIDHFTAYGNRLVALLLEHYLIEKKLVPF